MAPGEVLGLKNGEPGTAGVLGGDNKDRMASSRISVIEGFRTLLVYFCDRSPFPYCTEESIYCIYIIET